MVYDLWNAYLRVATEQVVASNFEVGMITKSSLVWFQGDLFNMGGVRRFYHYQSRLLQGGFSTLFGAKLQELYLKISFTLANSSSANAKLTDVLGIIARAKSSADAVTALNEISQIGQFTCDSESARHHEKVSAVESPSFLSNQHDRELLHTHSGRSNLTWSFWKPSGTRRVLAWTHLTASWSSMQLQMQTGFPHSLHSLCTSSKEWLTAWKASTRSLLDILSSSRRWKETQHVHGGTF